MSVISDGTGSVMSALLKSPPTSRSRRAHGIVVVAVDERRLLVQRAGTGQQIVLGVGGKDGRDGDGQSEGPGGKPGVSHGAIRP